MELIRPDVQQFAQKMSDVMNQKKVEREAANLPHYLSPEYPMREALLAVFEHTHNLVADVAASQFEVTEKEAVHLANYCMIVLAKLDVRYTGETARKSS